MKQPLCIPIRPRSHAELLQLVPMALSVGQLIELYVDYMDEIREASFEFLSQAAPNSVVTLRRPGFESTHHAIDELKSILPFLSNKQLILDLDIYKERALIEEAQKLVIELMPSYHDYFQTPSTHEIDIIIKDIRLVSDKRIKIATQCNDEFDSLRLLNTLLQLRNQFEVCVISGMGNYSKVTRIFGSYWGNSWTYAPRETVDATARGQFSADSLINIFRSIGE